MDLSIFLFNIVYFYWSNIVHAPSEAGSQTSSFDSKLLNARKPDPEEILLGLGFGGGIESTAYSEYGRVPKRFLQPSQLKGVSVEEYIQHQQELIHIYESGLWGYRGLTGRFIFVPFSSNFEFNLIFFINYAFLINMKIYCFFVND